MTHSLDLPDNLAERANQLRGLLPEGKWHSETMDVITKELHQHHSLGIACSGGADSTFCLLLTFATFPELREKMVVLHYNHRLRGKDSDDDETFISSLAEKLGLRFFVKQSRTKKVKSDENTLRMERLLFLQSLIEMEGIHLVIQGHQLDDIAETLLWRIPRGVSVDGLISPKPISKIGSVTIVRPFVCITRDFIRDSLQRCSIPWREDASNLENVYLRNKMRNIVLPSWKKSCDRDLLQGIASTRDLLEKDSEALEFHAHEALKDCRSGEMIKLEPLQRQPIATQKRVLTMWMGDLPLTHSVGSHCASKAVQLVELLQNESFSSIQITKDYFVQKDNGFISLQKVKPSILIPISVVPREFILFLSNGSKVKVNKIKATDNLIDQILGKKINPEKEAYVSGLDADEPLRVRSRQKGDSYKPLGAPGTKKLSDWMIDRKWSAVKKVETPIFLNKSDEIIWIPGFPPAESTKVSHGDKWVIRLTYRQSDTL